MANYYGTTVCEGGELKKGSEQKVQEIIDKYEFQGNEDDVTVAINGGVLEIYGTDSVSAYRLPDEGSEEDEELQGDIDYDNECFEEFLEEIAPYIEESLVVKEVGNEKCRYVCAFAYIIKNGKVSYASLDNAITEQLKKM